MQIPSIFVGPKKLGELPQNLPQVQANARQYRVYLVAAEPSEEVPEHEAIAFQVADDRLYTVSSVLLVGMGFASPSPFAGDMNPGEERALTASIPPVGQQMFWHFAGV